MIEEMGLVMDFFFFQAEDGIRDIGVTGVQTCALPIFCEYFCMSFFFVHLQFIPLTVLSERSFNFQHKII